MRASAGRWPRIVEVVRRRFKVEYTLAGLDLLLHRIGWSVQVPARRAAGRDEAQIARWRKEAWPVVKGRRRTWAPGWSSKTNPARA
jgi:Winged helix-turn helix